jgi:SAM-dependent methyltransferase
MQRSGAREPGYLTDVAYVRQFVKELSPALLRAACALGGAPPPPEDAFDYCELGCGTGDTLNTLAAAYPAARFVGVDFNGEHVAVARDTAARGGLGNARFLERDFADLAAGASSAVGAPDDLPSFDYVAAHGVLAWIAPATRAAMLDFAAARLRPGGVLYVSYNAMPGWAAVEPLRRLLLDASAQVEGTSVDRARAGLAAARALAEAHAEYFESNPAAREMLATAEQAGLPYVAHEYLGSAWQPRYFADVAAEMAARDLAFVGQLPLYLGDRDLALPASTAGLLKDVGDRLAFEHLKDFAINEFFRGDVYRRAGGAAGRSGHDRGAAREQDVARAFLDVTPFGTLVPADAVKRQVRLRHHVLAFEGRLHDALVERLAAAPRTVPELARDPELAAYGADAIREAVRRLLLGEQVTPMRADPPPPAAAYNRAILEQRLSAKTPVVLASPVAGTGIVVSTLHAVALRLLTGVAPGDRDAWIRAFVARQPLSLQVAGRPVASADEQAAVLAQEVDRFARQRLPRLVALGVTPARDPAPG